VSTSTAELLRIGDVARAVGTTTRTIRYYEEIGLLPGAGGRAAGRHRAYTPEDAERLRDVLRMKELLGVSLEELRVLIDAEDARAELRSEWHHGAPGAGRRREILKEALRIADRQLELVRSRAGELARFERETTERRTRLRARLAELDA
jgi:DNA-binding transcriptional MerR regulator